MKLETNLSKSLIEKFDLLKKRCLLVIEQLNENELVWQPNNESNSIANLSLHIRETVRYRVESLYSEIVVERERDNEFETGLILSKTEIVTHVTESFVILKKFVQDLSEEELLEKPYLNNNTLSHSAMNKDATVLDVCLQMLAHLSEHVGQIFYIVKLIKSDQYITTTFPKKR